MVQVDVGNQRISANVANGRWRVILPPIHRTGLFNIRVSSAGGEVARRVYIGDVWLCAGQSNMGMTFKQSVEISDALGAAEDPELVLRNLSVHGSNRSPDLAAQSMDPDSFQSANRRSLLNFSALCGLFGLELRREQRIPIGLISAAAPASRIEAWLPDERPTILSGERDWSGTVIHPRNAPKYFPGELRRSMVEALSETPIAGIIWYQGESDAITDPSNYSIQLARLIDDWRILWKDKELPVIVVQIPGRAPLVRGRVAVGFAERWQTVQQAQADVATRMPNVFLVKSADIGDGTMHPRSKMELAKRVASMAIGHGRR
jgi:sialate O-acetylesterase